MLVTYKEIQTRPNVEVEFYKVNNEELLNKIKKVCEKYTLNVILSFSEDNLVKTIEIPFISNKNFAAYFNDENIKLNNSLKKAYCDAHNLTLVEVIK